MYIYVYIYIYIYEFLRDVIFAFLQCLPQIRILKTIIRHIKHSCDSKCSSRIKPQKSHPQNLLPRIYGIQIQVVVNLHYPE